MRSILAWALYWAGDLVSRLDPFPDRDGLWFELHYHLIYLPYQRLMGWSVRVQGDGAGPWQR